MTMTRNWKNLAVIGAGLGATLVAQTWRNRARYDFTGKSVVITGGSRGLGLLLARQLAGEGARLTLVARDEAELGRAYEDIRRRHPVAEVMTVAADVTQKDEASDVIEQTITRFGRVDVLINNAGIIQSGPLDNMTLQDFDEAMKTHFWGPLYLVMAVRPLMTRQGGGRIVNISSVGGRIAVPHLLPYSASKFALVGLSDGLRIELARENIVVTTVCPGLMRTGSPMNALFKGQREKEYAWFAIADSLPFTSINADRAARQIVNACRRGDAELIISVQAKLAILARTVAPELFAEVMTFVNGLLPGPSPVGNEARPGRESTSAWAPSPLTTLTQRAARANNEV